jgi:hypothetical protein
MLREDFLNDYWSYYLHMEKKVLHALDYVELSESNFSTYSKEFASLIEMIGAELDCFFKIYCEFQPSSKKNISDYCNYILNDDSGTTSYKIIVRSKQISFIPFEKWDKDQAGKSLSWWIAYNNLKHSRVLNFKDASLENCLNILAALFLLEMQYLRRIVGNEDMDMPDKESELFYIYQWNPKWASLRDGNFVVQLRE